MSTAPCTIPAVRQYLQGALDDVPERPSLAEVLRDHGYDTKAIVSQHQFYRGALAPYDRGFASFDIQDREQVNQHGMTARSASVSCDSHIALRLNSRSGDRSSGSPF